MEDGTPITEEKILRGLLSLFILREICISRKYGYQLTKVIREKTSLELPRGTIYVLLKNLQKKGYIKPENIGNDITMKNRRVYNITEKGEEFIKSHYLPLRIARGLIEDILSTLDVKYG